jgi:Bacteriocin-protection, YdeI or OmpD-Associated/Domain of unknown function (DUF1905)
MRFPATVEPAGNATGIEIPAEIVIALGAGKRPKVAITINGHTWRSRVASVGGRFIVGISAANRAACGIAEGDRVEAELQLDTAPRLVAEPPDLAEALDSDPQARAAFDRLAYGLKRKHVRAIQDAKTPQTRRRRITKLITTIRGHHNMGEDAGPAAAAGIEVAEVIRPNRQARRRRGKSDAADAVAAAVAALSGEASGMPKSRDGAAEAGPGAESGPRRGGRGPHPSRPPAARPDPHRTRASAPAAGRAALRAAGRGGGPVPPRWPGLPGRGHHGGDGQRGPPPPAADRGDHPA